MCGFHMGPSMEQRLRRTSHIKHIKNGPTMTSTMQTDTAAAPLTLIQKPTDERLGSIAVVLVLFWGGGGGSCVWITSS